jgi:hypothetical protein
MDLLYLKVWNEMKTIALSEMNDIRLMNRIDTKYLIHESLLPELLEKIKNDYRVQVVNSLPVSRYETTYFDTVDIDMYLCHHDNKLDREKIRTRRYVESDLSFLEIKSKSNKGRTTKERMIVGSDDFADFKNNLNAVEFLNKNSIWSDKELLPQVISRFERITLVNNKKTERLTIDGNLAFFNKQTGLKKEIPGLMIIELKQDGKYASLFRNLLIEYKILPNGFSKYCLGTVATNPNAKHNRFKSKIRYINKLIKNDHAQL